MFKYKKLKSEELQFKEYQYSNNSKLFNGTFEEWKEVKERIKKEGIVIHRGIPAESIVKGEMPIELKNRY